MKKQIFLSLICLLFFTYSKKNVYVYFNGPAQYYYTNKHDFYVTLFGYKYEVKLVNSLCSLSDPEYIITEEIPHSEEERAYLQQYSIGKRLLFSFEMASQPKNLHRAFLYLYSYVFTWDDDIINNVNIFKVRYPWMDPRPVSDNIPDFKQRKLSVFVGNAYDDSNRDKAHVNYQARINLSCFFVENAPHDFDLYGEHWDWKPFVPSIYKGPIPNGGNNRRLAKINVIKNYVFDFAFENTININGWISERIWESFAAGCIPIYWGADNVLDYIPENCLILRSNFQKYTQMYEFMKNFTEDDYYTYLENIKKFVSSDQVYQYSTEYYITQIRKVLNIED